MPPTRNVKRPRLFIRPRSEVDSAKHPSIDTALKSLRRHARKLATISSSLADELRVLERLYYKSLNQHRLQLYWRKVVEVRRLGQRIAAVSLPIIIDDLIYSFFIDERSPRKADVLKRPWTQVPDSTFARHALERTTSLTALCTQAGERLASAYESLSMFMQSGAFVQLLLTFTAITSRLSHLVGEYAALCREMERTLQLLVLALCTKPSNSAATQIYLYNMPLSGVVSESTDFLHSTQDTEDLIDENAGSSSAFDPPPSPAGSAFEAMPQISRRSPSETPTPLTIDVFPSINQHQTTDDVSTESQPPDGASTSRSGPASSSKTKLGKGKVEKNKKRKKNEIDDIFGSL